MNNKELEAKLISYKSLLQGRIESIVQTYLPGARKKGIYYSAGDVEGNDGKSFSMNAHSGVFEDFASGETGDVIEFFKIRCGGSLGRAIKEIEFFLGIQHNEYKAPMIQYKTPIKDWEPLTEGDEIYSYLENRGIEPATVYKYGGYIKKKNRDVVVYICGKTKPYCANYKTTNGEKRNWLSPDAKKCLWGTKHDELTLEDLGDGKQIVITEGMEDALSFAQQGIYAVSLPAGASNTKWMEHSVDWLKRFERVIIATDTDEPGEKIASIIARSIGAAKCYRASFGEFKDANEFHLNETELDLESVCRDAKGFKPKSVLFDDEVIEIAVARNKASPKVALPFLGFDKDGFNWKCRTSELTVVVGQQTSGKSALMYNAAAYYLFKHNAKIGILSPEMYADGIRAHIVSIAGLHNFEYIFANPTCKESLAARDYTQDIITYHPDENKTLDDFYEWLEFCAAKGVQIIFVDALQDLSFNQEDFQEVMGFMKAIQHKAMEGSMHLFLTAHTGKGDFSMQFMPNANSIRGSNTIASKAYNIISVGRNFQKWEKLRSPSATPQQREDAQDEADGKLLVCKDKWAGNIVGESLGYCIDPATKRIYSSYEDKNTVWN